MTEVRRTQPDPTAAAVRAAQAEAEALREAADALDTRAGQLHEAYAEAKRGLKIGSGLLRDRADRLACCDSSQESSSEVSDEHTDTAAPEGFVDGSDFIDSLAAPVAVEGVRAIDDKYDPDNVPVGWAAMEPETSEPEGGESRG